MFLLLCIYVTNLVFTFSFYKYKNHFEFPRVVRSPQLKFWKFLGGGGVIKDPLERKILGGGGVQIKMSSVGGGGMDIFWNHTMFIVKSFHLYDITGYNGTTCIRTLGEN